MYNYLKKNRNIMKEMDDKNKLNGTYWGENYNI